MSCNWEGFTFGAVQRRIVSLFEKSKSEKTTLTDTIAATKSRNVYIDGNGIDSGSNNKVCYLTF